MMLPQTDAKEWNTMSHDKVTAARFRGFRCIKVEEKNESKNYNSDIYCKSIFSM